MVSLRRFPPLAVLPSCLVLMLLTGLLSAAPAEAAGRSTLGGVNEISGSRTGYARIHVPRKTTLTLPRNGLGGAVTVKGRGPFVGVVITTDGVGPKEPLLIAGRFHDCSGPACPRGRRAVPYKSRRTVVLPKGNHRLYLIADEGPASVRLRVPGLKGSRSLKASIEAPGIAKRPEVRKDINTGGAFYGAGWAFEGGTNGVWVGMLRFRAQGGFEGQHGICRYSSPFQPPEQVAYGVQCGAMPAQTDHEVSSVRSVGDDEMRTLISMFKWGDEPNLLGRYGAGLWYRSTGAVRQPTSQAFYLSFDDDAPLPDRKSDTRVSKGKRVTKWHYEGPAVGVAGAGVCTHPIHACGLFTVDRGERKVSFSIEDETGLPVYASISERDDSGNSRSLGTLCGETEEPLTVTPGSELVIFPWLAGNRNCPGIATTGEIVAAFSR